MAVAALDVQVVLNEQATFLCERHRVRMRPMCCELRQRKHPWGCRGCAHADARVVERAIRVGGSWRLRA